MSIRDDLMTLVVRRYIDSGDFNGLYLRKEDFSELQVDELVALIMDGLIEVIHGQDFMNPHIRPWSSPRSIDQQVQDVVNVLIHDVPEGMCLYPTEAAMKNRSEAQLFDKEPYRGMLAAGRGQLELVFFTVDVIEQYRNDPRYLYWFGDFDVTFGIGDAAYFDKGEAERDKFASIRVGFAYDPKSILTEKVARFACSFLRDLAALTPEHQQRWRTYEVEAGTKAEPHPVWWAMMRGEWPEGIGPFHRILAEIEAINDLSRLSFGFPLFKVTDRPREWGWVLRSSTQEWHQFLLVTDKLLSDNLSHKTLTAAGVPRDDEDGQAAGSITRLEWFLRDVVKCGANTIEMIVSPMREVRKGRQAPAHQLVVAKTDATLAAQQRDLLKEIGDALYGLRDALMSLPAAKDWKVPPELTGRLYRL